MAPPVQRVWPGGINMTRSIGDRDADRGAGVFAEPEVGSDIFCHLLVGLDLALLAVVTGFRRTDLMYESKNSAKLCGPAGPEVWEA